MRGVIGVFDSGVGGVSVLNACVRRLPHLCYLYLGDNARAPYGSRPEEEIAAFTREALVLFRAKGADAAILACNTATAACLGAMRKEFSFPVLGTEPAVFPAAREGKKILVLCTPRTAKSERLRALLSRCPTAEFTVHACPDLAAAVERKFLRGEGIALPSHLPAGRFDGVVLGCTHYALIAEEIAAFYGAPVYDGAEGIARRLQALFGAERVDGAWSERGEINKSLQFWWRKKEGVNVCFLGKSGKINRKVFEQTFHFVDFSPRG